MSTQKITLTQAQLTRIIGEAVKEALASSQEKTSSSAGKKVSSKKTSSKKTSSSKKKTTKKPQTREEALTQAYGDAQTRKAHVQKDIDRAHNELDALEVVYSVNDFGKVTFAPYAQQNEGVFDSKAHFSQFRESFRKRHPYI